MLSSENWNEVFGESRHIKKDVGTLTEANSDHIVSKDSMKTSSRRTQITFSL